jgi:hypothetical protein
MIEIGMYKCMPISVLLKNENWMNELGVVILCP